MNFINRAKGYVSRRLNPAPAVEPETILPAPARPSPAVTRSGYAAYGEDIMAVAWFQHFGIELTQLRYLDIGAAHPWQINNTYKLYEYGASGVLVEPDPDQAKALQLARPRDTVLNVGAAFDERRSGNLNRMTTSLFNSFSDEQADFVVRSSEGWQPEQRQELRERREIPLVPINELIAEHLGQAPDFLSIDAETLDVPILLKLDMSRFKPWIVCMEAVTDRKLADDIWLPQGYVLSAFTPDNFMYMIDPFSTAWHEFKAGSRRHPI